MDTHIKSSKDLFPSKQEHDDRSEELGTSACESNSARQAGAAQKSARTRKSAAAFRTISEVASDLGLQQHVLRFWETKFSQVKPLKRGGGRRYYRPEDIRLLQAIHHLLYVEGYTIKGVQKLLREVGKKQIVDNFSGDEPIDPTLSRVNITQHTDDSKVQTQEQGANRQGLNDEQREVLKSVLSELKGLRGMIKTRD